MNIFSEVTPFLGMFQKSDLPMAKGVRGRKSEQILKLGD